ncbi:MAG: hypothetical protein KatS3mg019_2011 [Fimbriimonadales bacterium]|nr:MAG: hypothetical protein KatS3mg019_2011 [Fimbriimonadales bacterium]
MRFKYTLTSSEIHPHSERSTQSLPLQVLRQIIRDETVDSVSLNSPFLRMSRTQAQQRCMI